MKDFPIECAAVLTKASNIQKSLQSKMKLSNIDDYHLVIKKRELALKRLKQLQCRAARSIGRAS